MSWDLSGWTFAGNMRVTDEGMEMLFGRPAMAERLLWELTDQEYIDSEMGDTLCCDTYLPGQRLAGITIKRHDPACPWMRAHRFLNRSTDHGDTVHEFAHTP